MTQTDKQFKPLKNPPIKEVSLEVYCSNFLTDIKETEYVYKLLASDYPNMKPAYLLNQRVNPKDGKIETLQTVNGTFMTNADNSENIFVNLHGIRFCDRNKYSGFKDYYDKFKKIFEAINNSKPFSYPINISLEYVNVFSLQKEELINVPVPKIKFLPSLQITEENGNFAGLTAFSGNYIVQSNTFSGIQAMIGTDLQFIGNPVKLQVIFAIKAFSKIKNLSEIDNELQKLRTFKNEIFFSNISRDIESFKCQTI